MELLAKLIDYGVMGTLVLMSVGSLAIAIERLMFYKKLNTDHFKDFEALEIALTERLYILASIGSNAPYIGLLGTVLGIILVFQTIGSTGMGEPGEIMVSLALTMKVTAAGLIVAIPTLFLYNMLIRRVRVIKARWRPDDGR